MMLPNNSRHVVASCISQPYLLILMCLDRNEVNFITISLCLLIIPLPVTFPSIVYVRRLYTFLGETRCKIVGAQFIAPAWRDDSCSIDSGLIVQILLLT